MANSALLLACVEGDLLIIRDVMVGFDVNLTDVQRCLCIFHQFGLSADNLLIRAVYFFSILK